MTATSDASEAKRDPARVDLLAFGAECRPAAAASEKLWQRYYDKGKFAIHGARFGAGKYPNGRELTSMNVPQRDENDRN